MYEILFRLYKFVKYKRPNFTMRFKLHLRPISSRPRIMWNYHYPLSAWLYSKITSADESYSTFLHDTGYKLNNRKSFKHFTFSDLRCKIGKSDTKGFEVGLDNVTVAGASVSLIQFCVTEFEVLPAGSVCATL